MEAHKDIDNLVDTDRPMLTIIELFKLNLSEQGISKYISIYNYASGTLKDINNEI